MISGFTVDTFTNYVKGETKEPILENYPENPITEYKYIALILKAKSHKSIQKALKYIKRKWFFDGSNKKIQNTIHIYKKKNSYTARIFLQDYNGTWWTPHKAFTKVAKNNPNVKIYLDTIKIPEKSLDETERLSRITKKAGYILINKTIYHRKWYEYPYDIVAEYANE